MPNPQTKLVRTSNIPTTRIVPTALALATAGLLTWGGLQATVPDDRVAGPSALERLGKSRTGGFTMIKGLGTVIYPVSDLTRAKAWYAKAFQQQPYFDQPFYVGFNIAGYELGLDPDSAEGKPGLGGGLAYWRVTDIEAAIAHFVGIGARVVAPVRDVGDRVKVATVADPFGNSIGLIENPHFRLPEH
jgi:predicted enzyme related to lactoylglutathione lyase